MKMEIMVYVFRIGFGFVLNAKSIKGIIAVVAGGIKAAGRQTDRQGLARGCLCFSELSALLYGVATLSSAN